jgi:hypothetical protein
MQRRARLLEDRSRHRGNHRSAMAASVCRTTRNAVMFPLDSALLAERNAAGKPLFLEMFKARIVIGELAVKIIDRIPQMLWDCLSPVHGNSMPNVLLDVKG